MTNLNPLVCLPYLFAKLYCVKVDDINELVNLADITSILFNINHLR